MERVRLIEAEWQEGADKEQFGEYHAEIKIFCHDRSGLLVDITKVFTEAEINISGIHSKTSKQGIDTPRPRVTNPTISSPGTGLQHLLKCTATS